MKDFPAFYLRVHKVRDLYQLKLKFIVGAFWRLGHVIIF